MDKLTTLQERYEALQNKQVQRKAEADTLMSKENPTAEETARFDALVTEVRAGEVEIPKLLKQIDDLRMLDDIETREKVAQVKQTRKPEDQKIKEDFKLERAFAAAVSGRWDNAGLEREVMQENARGSNGGWDVHKLIISPDMAMAGTRADAYSVLGTAEDGGNLVGTEYRPDKFVDALWNMTVLDKLPVVRNTGITQQQSIAVSTSKVTASMVTEVASTGDSGKLTFGLKTATPKEMITKGSFSRMLDLTSAPAIRNVFNNQIMKAIAGKLDQQFIEGSGSSGQMYGILGLTAGGGSDQTTVVAIGTNGGAPTYAKVIELRTTLAADNIPQPWVFLTNANVTSKMMTTLKDSANTNSGYILMDGQTNLIGHKIVESQVIPNNLTKGSSSGVCSALILGRFDETEVFQWGNVAIEFDPYSGANNSLVYVRSFSFWDIIHKRPENYAIIKDLTTT